MYNNELNEITIADNGQASATAGNNALESQNDNSVNSLICTGNFLPVPSKPKFSAQDYLTLSIDTYAEGWEGKCIYDQDGNIIGHTPFANMNNTINLFNYCGFVVRYNLMRRSIELLNTPTQWGNTKKDSAVALTHILDIATRNKMQISKDKLYDNFVAIARAREYNPISETLSLVEWDGKDYLSLLAGCIESESTSDQLIYLLLKKWMISAVALGCAAENSKPLSASGMLVLVGAQGIGKSRFLKWLTKPFRDYFLEGATLNPSDKDSVAKVIKYWIVELGELDGTLSKADIALLKAMLTASEDSYRPPYERTEVIYRRRTVFAATINHAEFLEDKTGSRRFWTIDVKRFNYNKDIDTLQLWAQVYQLYLSGEQWHLTAEEQHLLETSNAQHQLIDVIDDGLNSKFDFSSDRKDWTNRLLTKEILAILDFDKPTQSETRRLTESLKALGLKPIESTRQGKRGRYWSMPQLFSNRSLSHIIDDYPLDD